MTTAPRHPSGDPSHLLSGHATDTLSQAERRQLYRAALDDQAIFDRLTEEESWRQIFSASGVKQDLLEALAEPAPGGGFRGWLAGFQVPAYVPRLAMGVAAAALLAVALLPRWLDSGSVGPGSVGPPAAPGAAPSNAAAPPAPIAAPPTGLVPKGYDPDAGTADSGPQPASGSRSLQPKSTGAGVLELSYTLELNQADGPRKVPDTWSFLAGDQFRLRLSVDFTAWLYLFNRAAGEATYSVLYPHTAIERQPLKASPRDVLLPAGVWLTMDDTPGDEELVLVVSTRPWPLVADGRDTIPAGELDAALKQAESNLSVRNWRRSEIEDRVRLAVEESDDAMVVVLRLLGEGS